METIQAKPGWETRMVAAVAEKLECDVSLARWERLRTGADVPVFNIPQDKRALAASLGLSFT